uniref:Uncharacterized protein n=1 Tax=Cairina moschata TaxID=8855 RepID=A0A8C3BY42_CAIMO
NCSDSWAGEKTPPCNLWPQGAPSSLKVSPAPVTTTPQPLPSLPRFQDSASLFYYLCLACLISRTIKSISLTQFSAKKKKMYLGIWLVQKRAVSLPPCQKRSKQGGEEVTYLAAHVLWLKKKK